MVQNQWYHFGIGAPPILEPILVGIGMFTGGTGFVTHGHVSGQDTFVVDSIVHGHRYPAF